MLVTRLLDAVKYVKKQNNRSLILYRFVINLM